MNGPSALPADLAPYLAGGMSQQLARALEGRAWDFFVYSTTFTNLAASGTATRDIPFQSDSSFLVMAGTLTGVTNAAPETVVNPAPVTIELFDSGSGRALFDRAQHARNVFGSGQEPCYWPFYRLVKPGSSVRVAVGNLDSANALDLYVSLLGVKVFNSNPGR